MPLHLPLLPRWHRHRRAAACTASFLCCCLSAATLAICLTPLCKELPCCLSAGGTQSLCRLCCAATMPLVQRAEWRAAVLWGSPCWSGQAQRPQHSRWSAAAASPCRHLASRRGRPVAAGWRRLPLCHMRWKAAWRGRLRRVSGRPARLRRPCGEASLAVFLPSLEASTTSRSTCSTCSATTPGKLTRTRASSCSAPVALASSWFWIVVLMSVPGRPARGPAWDTNAQPLILPTPT